MPGFKSYLHAVASKLDFIKTASTRIEARPDEALYEVAAEVLERLCDEWGYPRPHEIGRYQLKMGSVGGGRCSYFLRDKETGVVVHVETRDSESARRYALYQIRAATTPEQLEDCWPSRDSLHASLCTCKAQAKREQNLAISSWLDDDYDFEAELGYSRAEIDALPSGPAPGPRSRKSPLGA